MQTTYSVENQQKYTALSKHIEFILKNIYLYTNCICVSSFISDHSALLIKENLSGKSYGHNEMHKGPQKH